MTSITRRIRFLAVVCCSLVLTAACSIDNSTLNAPGAPDGARIVVGSGNSDASAVVAEIYAGVLRSTGAEVSVRTGLGERTDYLSALGAGEVTVVPEFTGELLTYFDPTAEATEPREVFAQLSSSLPQGFSVSDFASAENRSVLVLDRGVASEVHDLDDLAPRCETETLVIGDEFEESALASIPGCTFGAIHHAVDDRAVAEELRSGAASVAGLTTLSPVLGDGELVASSDDDGVFRAQNVVPLYRSGTLAERQLEALNIVAGELTSADLADMVAQVRGGAGSVEVARTWLGAHA